MKFLRISTMENSEELKLIKTKDKIRQQKLKKVKL